MPELTPIQFGTQIATHRSRPLSAELAENVYLEQAPQGAKNPYILIGTPGLKAFATVGDGPIRGVLAMGPHVYVVSGNEIYRVSQNGDYTLIGAIPGTGRVSMAHNDQASPGPYTWIATGHDLYAVNSLGNLQTVANGYGITHVTYQDGYLVGIQQGTQNLYISAIDNALSLSALDYTTADAFPGLNVGLEMVHRELYSLKEDSIEVFTNLGASAFPFQRSQTIERGCGAGYSVAKSTGALFFLGDDLQVYRVAGYQPTVISTPPVADLIAGQNSPHTAVAYIYQQGGHTFYVLTFSGLTVVYDMATGLWHKRSSYGYDYHRGWVHTFARRWNKNIVGDRLSGALYELDLDTYLDGSDPIIRRVVGTPLWNNGKRFVVDEFFLDIEGGVGLITGQGSDPQAMLDWSENGGKTWSNEVWRPFGAIGEFGKRTIWNGLGGHFSWTPRITMSDPVPFRVAGAYARVTRLSA